MFPVSSSSVTTFDPVVCRCSLAMGVTASARLLLHRGQLSVHRSLVRQSRTLAHLQKLNSSIMDLRRVTRRYIRVLTSVPAAIMIQDIGESLPCTTTIVV